MTAAHPSDEQLSHYGLGKLTGAANETVEAHITTCADCRQRVAALSSDGFLDRLKRAAQPEAMSGFEASQPPVEKSTVFSGDDANIPPALLTLSMYKDIRRLGHGGMGEIYLARNVHMDREEVLKVMSKSMMERSGAAARFRREIRSVGQLNHANIVTTYGVQQVGDTVVLSMEYAGEDLAKHLEKRGPLPVARACYYIHQAALGLQFAHEKGLVHRDIKPSNLMVLQNGAKWQVKILDFGLAKSRTEPPDASDIDHQTKTGQSLGTPAYMAPEQIRDAKSVDIRADIYALGCTLYYLLTGRPPFVEDNIMSLIFAHGEKIPQPTNELRADVPVALAELIAKMLAKDPKDRPQTPAEVAKALVPFIRPGAKQSEAVMTASQAETDVASQTQPILAPANRPPTRKRWPAVALGLVLLAIGAIAVGSLFIQTKDGTIELTDLDPDAVVFVDGDKVTVKWADGKQSAEIRVRPGTRKIEVKQGDITVLGETVELESNGRKVLAARQKIEPKPETPVDPKAGTIPPKPKEEFTPLFNGKDLTGWETSGMGPGSWRVEDGVLVGSFVKNGGGTILTWPKGLAPRHYHLRLVLKKSDEWAALIALFCDMKYTANNKNPGVWPWGGPGPGRFIVYTGCTTPKPDHEVGRLAYVAGNARDSATLLGGPMPIANNEWYTMDIVVLGQRVTVDVNGTRRADYTDPELPPEGRPFTLGCPGGATVRFKSIEFKELPAPAKAPAFTALFNGKQLLGFRSPAAFKGKWEIEDDLLVIRGIRNPRIKPNPSNLGVLESTRSYRDFILRIEHAPLEVGDHSMPVVVRMSATRKPFVGYEVAGGGFSKKGVWRSPGEIRDATENSLDDKDDDDDEMTSRPGFKVIEAIRNKPYTIEIAAIGNRITTSIDGVQVHETIDPSPTAGPIQLRARKATRVRYRKIEIQDLSAPNAKEPAPEVLQPVDPPAPEVDRTAKIRGVGIWKVDGDVLTGRASSTGLFFGDPNWKDYEFEVDYRVISGPPEVNVSVRRRMTFGFQGASLKLGTESNTIDLWADGDPKPLELKRKPMRYSDWNRVRFRVEDNRIQCFVGPVDKPQTTPDFSRTVRMPQSGQVELGIGYPRQPKAAVVEFKNIVVKSLDGKVLWEGLPELPVPDKAEGVPAKVPAGGRTAAIGNGQWRIDGDVLKQTNEAKGPAGLIFGDAKWTNYDLSVDVRWQTSAAQVVYRAPSLREKSIVFVRGKSDNAGQSQIGLETHDPTGDRMTDKPFDQKIILREWHSMKVSVRDNQATIFVNGREACVVRGLRHSSGKVGVRTFDGSAEFKNFRVTDPAGNVLWEGLPELPAP